MRRPVDAPFAAGALGDSPAPAQLPPTATPVAYHEHEREDSGVESASIVAPPLGAIGRAAIAQQPADLGARLLRRGRQLPAMTAAHRWLAGHAVGMDSPETALASTRRVPSPIAREHSSEETPALAVTPAITDHLARIGVAGRLEAHRRWQPPAISSVSPLPAFAPAILDDSAEEAEPTRHGDDRVAAAATFTMLPDVLGMVAGIQRKAEPGMAGFLPIQRRVLAMQQVAQSTGQPLESGTRRFMQTMLGGDYTDVRIHTDHAAASAAATLSAQAFTLGRSVYFGRGAYEPASPTGLALLGHELTHTLQQSSGVQRSALTGPAATDAPGDEPAHLEEQAQRTEASLLRRFVETPMILEAQMDKVALHEATNAIPNREDLGAGTLSASSASASALAGSVINRYAWEEPSTPAHAHVGAAFPHHETASAAAGDAPAHSMSGAGDAGGMPARVAAGIAPIFQPVAGVAAEATGAAQGTPAGLSGVGSGAFTGTLSMLSRMITRAATATTEPTWIARAPSGDARAETAPGTGFLNSLAIRGDVTAGAVDVAGATGAMASGLSGAAYSLSRSLDETIDLATLISSRSADHTGAVSEGSVLPHDSRTPAQRATTVLGPAAWRTAESIAPALTVADSAMTAGDGASSTVGAFVQRADVGATVAMAGAQNWGSTIAQRADESTPPASAAQPAHEASPAQPDIDELVHQVLGGVRRQLALEHERSGGFLPDLMR